MNAVLRRLTGMIMAVLIFVNTACYSYVPIAAGAVPAAGESVRVRLNAEGTAAQTSTLGPRVEWAEGTLSERRADGSIVIGVTQVRLLDGLDRFWSGQSVVTLPPEQVAEVQRRTIDRGRTRTATIVAIGAMIALVAMAVSVGGAHGGQDAGGASPPP